MTDGIIVQDLKLIIETDADEIEDHEEEALAKLIEGIDAEDIDLDSAKVNNFTVADICSLASAYKIVSNLNGVEIDKLFLYWLNDKNIEYSIDYDIDIGEYEKDGYCIIRQPSS